jgi:hypothetical protein
MEEFFDFEEASRARREAASEDFSSDYPEVDEAEQVSNYEALFFDKTFALPTDPPPPSPSDEPRLLESGVYPMYRAKEPCDLCRGMGLDCFIAQRGVMQNGCTCCISLWRECSFTHAKAPGVFLDTLHAVTEDVDEPCGGLTGKKALKSLPGGVDDFDGKCKKNGARFPREAVRVLKNWLAEHHQHPYPTDQEKDDMKQQTGLKKSQISNWLANARRRGKARPFPISPSEGEFPGAIDIPRNPVQTDQALSEMSPLERWKHSPPEHEAASATAIARAMANTPFLPHRNSSSYSLHKSQKSKHDSSNESSFSMFQAPSLSSLETGRSSTSDVSWASAWSRRSHGSLHSLDRKDRRRRRRPASTPQSVTAQKSRGARIFQCTFCTDTFPAKYDWQRHEKSLHLALEKWTCAPKGGLITIGGNRICAFCRAVNPTAEHIENHNFSTCQEKTLQERTFYRKDHLRQHLRLMHDVKFDASMEAWKSTTTEIKSRCGFCPKVFRTWQERIDHLAAHFKAGADMSQWEGDWGFEPYVSRLVENSMPPYLIAQERGTMNPWSAKSHCQTNSTPNISLSSNGDSSSPDKPPYYQDINCWRRLETELGGWTDNQLALGITPTDQMLQDQARVIIFGSDDPWNQTSADNAQWLEIFKRDHDVTSSQSQIPAVEDIRLEEIPHDPPYVIPGGLRQQARRVDSGGGVKAHNRANSSGFDTPMSNTDVNMNSPMAYDDPMKWPMVISAGAMDFTTSVSAPQILASSTPVSDNILGDMSFEQLYLQNLNSGFDDGSGRVSGFAVPDYDLSAQFPEFGDFGYGGGRRFG